LLTLAPGAVLQTIDPLDRGLAQLPYSFALSGRKVQLGKLGKEFRFNSEVALPGWPAAPTVPFGSGRPGQGDEQGSNDAANHQSMFHGSPPVEALSGRIPKQHACQGGKTKQKPSKPD